MKYGQIIRDAWHLTTENPKIKWLVLIPSFFAVLIFVLEIAWQAYLYLTKFEVIESQVTFENMGAFVEFLSTNGLWGIGVVAIVFILLFMFVVPPWITASVILCVKQKLFYPESELHQRQKLIQGSSHFFPLFEFYALTAIFSMVSILLFMASFYRYFDAWFAYFWPVFAIYVAIALVVNLFFSFAPYYIVSDKEGVVASLKKSGALVFLHLGDTLTIFLLMFLVNLRIIVNVIVILGIPVGIFAAITLFNSSTAWIISVLLAITAIGLTAYLAAIMTVFSTAVWLISFEILKKKKAEMEHADVDV